MRIIQLPEAQAIYASDVFAININGKDYQVPVSLLVTAMQTLGNYLTAGDVANNLTTTAAGKVLDARQGPALTELIAQSTAHSAYVSSDVFNAQSGGTIKTNYSFAAKAANVCFMQLNVTATSSGSIVTVAELKPGFIPYNKNVYTMAIDENDNSAREVFINANAGLINIYNAVSGHTYNISATYIV